MTEPLTIDQLYLLAMDNTARSDSKTFANPGIDPESVLDWLEHCLQADT
ncbi:MAG: hypothetical protein RQ826_15810 [Xanthomonadales bacterium]|nr:hypothetical protein [Xanthomonadales bacterium]